MWFARQSLGQRIHQARFADSSLSAEQYSLAQTLFGLLPAVQKQSQFLLQAD